LEIPDDHKVHNLMEGFALQNKKSRSISIIQSVPIK
jgi:hypothetical protein